MQDVKSKIQSIVKSATSDEKPKCGKTITEISKDIGIENPSKAVVTELGIAIKKLKLETKRTAKGRITFCDDWDALYKELGLQ
jgi:hypothetical protein